MTEIQRTFDGCLAAAEETFGAREAGWDYKVKLLETRDNPETVVLGPGRVRINLNKYLNEGGKLVIAVGYIFEAGHEAVHCLNPRNGGATFLEEAVAVAFSLRVSGVAKRQGFYGVAQNLSELPQDYRRAVELATKIDDDVVRLGRRLRERVGSLKNVGPADVKELYPQVPESIVLEILGAFPRQG